jgi:DNA-binding NarL/FixJ family response regulator
MDVLARSLLRVVIADDNPVVRLGVRTALTSTRIEIVAEAENGREAIEQVRLHLPDVLLLDVRMPLLDGLAAIPEVSVLTRVIMLTGADDPATVMRALSAGAHGYLVHGEFDPAALGDVVTKVARGRSVLCSRAATVLVNRLQDPRVRGGQHRIAGLTRRESEIMALIAEGLSNRQIAHRLVISEKTVKNHIVSIYRRFGVDSRDAAIIRWREP